MGVVQQSAFTRMRAVLIVSLVAVTLNAVSALAQNQKSSSTSGSNSNLSSGSDSSAGSTSDSNSGSTPDQNSGSTSDSNSSSGANSGSNQNSNNAKIIPPAPDAIGGGNPFQGLGRADEASPSRRSQFESPDPPNPNAGSTDPNAGATNPNVPPDLPPAPTTEKLQKEKEEKEMGLEDLKRPGAKSKEKALDDENYAQSAEASADTPLKKAMLAINLRNYEQSLTVLDQLLATNSKNAEAHYLKAIVLVLTRRYDAAATEYHRVLNSNPSESLSRKARTGLTKLAR